jgi:hypothetical protein
MHGLQESLDRKTECEVLQYVDEPASRSYGGAVPLHMHMHLYGRDDKMERSTIKDTWESIQQTANHDHHDLVNNANTVVKVQPSLLQSA